jgi:hypothetical protein
MTDAHARASRSTPQPGSGGSVSGATTFGYSTTEPGHPWVITSGIAWHRVEPGLRHGDVDAERPQLDGLITPTGWFSGSRMSPMTRPYAACRGGG